MNGLWLDLRYGIRTLLRAPGFAAVAIVTLALGLGANTAIFSVVHAVLLRGLPYEDPERLVAIFEKRPRENRIQGMVSPADFVDWREQSRSFTGMSAGYDEAVNLIHGEAYRLTGMVVSPNFFEVAGVKPVMGAGFTAEHEVPGKHLAAILTYGAWQRRFGASPDILSTTLNLSGKPFQVVGVLPPDFEIPTRDVELFLPFPIRPEDRTNRAAHFLAVFARLKPGVTQGQAQTEMDGISRRLEQEHRVNRGHAANVVPLQESLVAEIRLALLVLFGAVGFVLLIACANLANLLLARALKREREISIRLAVGAGRGRVVRQLLTESVLLATVAGLVGVAFAVWSVDALSALMPRNLNFPGADRIEVNPQVLLFTTVLTLASAILFGLAPAWQAMRKDLNETLKSGGRSALSSARHGLRQGLVMGEVALSLVLLTGAGLLLRSFDILRHVHPGFTADKVITMPVALPAATYNDDHRKLAFASAVTERLRALPGVTSVGFTSHLPVSGADSRMGFVVENIPANPDEPRRAHWRIVGPGYFETMGIPLRAGRFYTHRDTRDAPPVIMVNEAAARKFWKGESPIGKRARFSNTEQWREVIGVVGNVRHWGLDVEPLPEAYLPFHQEPFWSLSFVIRSDGDPMTLTNAARMELRNTDKELPAGLIRTMNDVIATSLSGRRFPMIVLLTFAGVAMALAAAGVYGVISYMVSRRTQEIGVRMAMGADRRAILVDVFRGSSGMVAAGTLLGIAASFGTARLLQTLVYGITVMDPMTFVAAPVLLMGVALLAIWIPARRATRVDPMVALRYE